MRPLAAVLALSLVAAPAFARKNASKGPHKGGHCSKIAVGTTSTDSKGASLECKADKGGKPRWTRK